MQTDDIQPQDWKRWAWAGARRALAGPVWFMSLGFVGTGSLAHDAGAPLGVAILSTPLIWAGPAQVLYFGSLAAGTAYAAIALSMTLSSIRLLLLCVSLLPMLRGRRMGLWLLFWTNHNIAITSWAESMLRLPAMPRDARMPYFMGFVHVLMAGSTIAIGVGWLVSSNVPPLVGGGMLLVAPLYFFTTVIGSARQAIDWMAIGFGLAFAPVTRAFVPGGFDLLALGVAGGTLAYGIDRIMRARRAEASS